MHPLPARSGTQDLAGPPYIPPDPNFRQTHHQRGLESGFRAFTQADRGRAAQLGGLLGVPGQPLPQIPLTQLASRAHFHPRSPLLLALPQPQAPQTLPPACLRRVHGRRQSRAPTHVFRWHTHTGTGQLPLGGPKPGIFPVQLNSEDGGRNAHAGVPVVDGGGCERGDHQSIQMNCI